MASVREAKRSGRKRVYYLSLEFLIGRLLEDALGNLGLREPMRARSPSSSASISTAVAALEPDAALGNGGLGRLAACFMESMATLAIPGHGYGIRYDHGLFRQRMSTAGRSNIPRTGCPSAIRGSSSGRSHLPEIGFGGRRPRPSAPDGTPRRSGARPRA
jgi:starch phosphorylase